MFIHSKEYFNFQENQMFIAVWHRILIFLFNCEEEILRSPLPRFIKSNTIKSQTKYSHMCESLFVHILLLTKWLLYWRENKVLWVTPIEIWCTDRWNLQDLGECLTTLFWWFKLRGEKMGKEEYLRNEGGSE